MWWMGCLGGFRDGTSTFLPDGRSGLTGVGARASGVRRPTSEEMGVAYRVDFRGEGRSQWFDAASFVEDKGWVTFLGGEGRRVVGAVPTDVVLAVVREDD